MAEKPILFSGPLVRAILESRKTQTRRVLTAKQMRGYTMDERDDGTCWPYRMDWSPGDPEGSEWRRSPYGEPGDTLWVRESFGDRPDPPLGLTGDVLYRATHHPDSVQPERWRPSIHMPRWACRLTLRVTDVRVERVQDISEEDARAEGIRSTRLPLAGAGGTTVWHADEWPTPICGDTARGAFRALWDSIAKPGVTWDDDPWVWVVGFEVKEVRGG